MVLNLIFLLEIILAFFVHLLCASPVSLGKRGTFEMAGGAFHKFN